MNKVIFNTISVFIIFILFSCGESATERQNKLKKEREMALKAEKMALKIAVNPTLDCLPVFVAQENKMFENQKVSVMLKLFNAQMDCDTAFIGKSVEGMFSDLVHTEFLKRHNKIKMDYVSSTNAYWQLLSNHRARIKSTSQMNDKMVGMTRFSATDFLTSKTLTKNDHSQQFRIQINDMNIRLAMLLNNEIDAVWLQEPFAATARSKGHHVIADSRDYKNNLGVIAFRSELNANKMRNRQIAAFIKTYNMACDSINKNGIGHYADIIHKYCKVNDKTIKAIEKQKYNHAGYPDKADIEVAKSFY